MNQILCIQMKTKFSFSMKESFMNITEQLKIDQSVWKIRTAGMIHCMRSLPLLWGRR